MAWSDFWRRRPIRDQEEEEARLAREESPWATRRGEADWTQGIGNLFGRAGEAIGGSVIGKRMLGPAQEAMRLYYEEAARPWSRGLYERGGAPFGPYEEIQQPRRSLPRMSDEEERNALMSAGGEELALTLGRRPEEGMEWPTVGAYELATDPINFLLGGVGVAGKAAEVQVKLAAGVAAREAVPGLRAAEALAGGGRRLAEEMGPFRPELAFKAGKKPTKAELAALERAKQGVEPDMLPGLVKAPTDIQVGDWIRDKTGLPVRGQVVGEGILGKDIPAWKVDMGGGNISAMPKDTSELWQKAVSPESPGMVRPTTPLEEAFGRLQVSPGDTVSIVEPYSNRPFTGVLQGDGRIIAPDGQQMAPNWERLTAEDLQLQPPPPPARAAPRAAAKEAWGYHRTSKQSLQGILEEGMDQGDFTTGRAIDFPGDVTLRVRVSDIPPGQVGEYGKNVEWILPGYEKGGPIPAGKIEIQIGRRWVPLADYPDLAAKGARMPEAVTMERLFSEAKNAGMKVEAFDVLSMERKAGYHFKVIAPDGREFPVRNNAEGLQRIQELTQAPMPEPAVAAKEPWQMTRAEFGAGMSTMERRNASLMPISNPKSHYAQIVKAIKEGKPVPPEVRAEWRDLPLSEGKPVLPEVLADYPDLAAKAAVVERPEFTGQAGPKRVRYNRASLQSAIDAALRLKADAVLYVTPSPNGYNIGRIYPAPTQNHVRVSASGRVMEYVYDAEAGRFNIRELPGPRAGKPITPSEAAPVVAEAPRGGAVPPTEPPIGAAGGEVLGGPSGVAPIERRISEVKTLEDIQALRAELATMPRSMGRSINEITLTDIERAIRGESGITVAPLRQIEPPPGGGLPPTGGPEVMPPGGQERGFVTHTGESPMGNPVLRKLYDEDPVVYGPITNRRTLDEAAKSVDADAVAARARVMSDDPLDPDTMVDTMAQGIVLMRRAATDKNTKELYELSRHIAERLTSSAQAVQLASTIDKLTPEGLFVYLNRIIKKAIEKGQGPTVAKRIQAAVQKETVKRETRAASDAVVEAERKQTQARKRVQDVSEAGTSKFVGGKPTTRGGQRARDLEYLIDDSVREVKASLTPAERQAVIKAKAILKQSVAEMDIETANSFLDRAAALDKLAGEERIKALMDLVEEVRQLPEVKAGDVLGGTLRPSPRLLKEQAADLTQLVDRTARNVFQSLNSVDRLAVARVKAILRRTDIELPQGMAEELLAEARSLRGLPKADQATALNKLTTKIKEFDPVAKELARKRAVADAEARVRQEARQAANDLEALIDAHSRKVGLASTTLANRKAIGQAKAVLTKYGAELPVDMATDFLERAKGINALPGAEQAGAIRALVDEIKNFDPVKQAREALANARTAAARAKQRAKDLEYLANEEVRVAKTRAKNVERDAIRSAKSRFKSAGVEMPEELAQSFLDRAEALRGITDEYDQMRAAQSLMRDVNSLLPPSKWDALLNVLGLPRAMKAAFDLSFPLRQGIFQLYGHPKEWWAAFKSNIATFRSEDAAIAADRAFFNRPFHKPGVEAGLEYVDRLGPIFQQEETFITSGAGRIPGARASERAYTTTGNKLRGDAFDSVIMDWLPREVREQVEDGVRRFDTLDELIQATGKTKEDFTRLAQWMNVTTGRGDMAKFLKSNNQWLNALFFAPRFAVSRFQVPYMGIRNIAQNPALRKTVARDLGGLVAGSTAMLVLVAQVPGVEVEWDPRSSDFGKFRYGSLSIDFLGGYAPLVRYIVQFSLGQKKSRGGFIQDVNRLEVLLENFLGTKLAPVPSEAVDMLRGEDALGNPLETWEERIKRVAKDFVPFLAGDIWEAWQEDGLVGAGITAPISLFGGSAGAYKTVSDNFDKVAKTATGGKITRWQDLPPAARLKLESSPEVKALLREGETGISMNLRKYIEPKDYERWATAVTKSQETYAALPEIKRLGLTLGTVGDEINNQRLTLQQRALYQELVMAGAQRAAFLPALFANGIYRNASDEVKKQLIARVMDKVREAARGILWSQMKKAA